MLRKNNFSNEFISVQHSISHKNECTISGDSESKVCPANQEETKMKFLHHCRIYHRTTFSHTVNIVYLKFQLP